MKKFYAHMAIIYIATTDSRNNMTKHDKIEKQYILVYNLK